MIQKPWWERWPEVLQREETALGKANILWQRNEDAFSNGILQLDLTLPAELGGHKLLVVYPDCYPYFRFQVYAPDLNLPYHMNPFEHNLCLMGRRTHWWHTTDTAAGIIVEQLPTLLKTAAAKEAAEVAGLEEQQAEPFSDYYTYAPSMILIDEDWVIGAEHKSGTMLIATAQSGDELAEQFVRGAIVELRSEKGDLLFSAGAGLRAAFPGKTLEARWARIDDPIQQPDVFKFMEELVKRRPEVKDAKANHVKDRWLRIWGVLFHEQTQHRILGSGWVFTCLLDKKRPEVPKPHFSHQKTSRPANRSHRR
jgi:hypothetical protein